MYSFDLKLDALVSSSVFAEATAEELRVLLALASLGGEATKTQLSALASVGVLTAYPLIFPKTVSLA